jgi:hypothetical protein
MNAITQLVGFYDAISGDQRISAAHISLYMALFRAWLKNRCQNPVSLERASVMSDAKISARSTYNKCLRELHEYGYLRYEPSFNSCLQSLVYVLPLKGN